MPKIAQQNATKKWFKSWSNEYDRTLGKIARQKDKKEQEKRQMRQAAWSSYSLGEFEQKTKNLNERMTLRQGAGEVCPKNC